MVLPVRIHEYVIGDGAVADPVPGEEITTGLGFILTEDRDPAGHPEAQVLTGILRRVGPGLLALDGEVTAVIMPDVMMPAALVGTEVWLWGWLVAEPYLWAASESGSTNLRSLLPHGWQTWSVLSRETILASATGDVLVRLEAIPRV